MCMRGCVSKCAGEAVSANVHERLSANVHERLCQQLSVCQEMCMRGYQQKCTFQYVSKYAANQPGHLLIPRTKAENITSS